MFGVLLAHVWNCGAEGIIVACALPWRPRIENDTNRCSSRAQTSNVLIDTRMCVCVCVCVRVQVVHVLPYRDTKHEQSSRMIWKFKMKCSIPSPMRPKPQQQQQERKTTNDLSVSSRRTNETQKKGFL
ncbi:hypothetical protein K504DRAFT_223689 [Pleomassaria siparia CBS 279.74]|uniref:Secreted protein n=1 Tax=Pleomassaria siparia CBS 279.74 TaxID=1314801 RepID=A0A6G1KGR2_9PLEO|nr:hypothetical protein K504DRAFT_223689 [Pleomassaria siparia CBS 279.74]